MVDNPDKAPLVWEWNGVPVQIDGYRIYLNRTPVGGAFVPFDDMPKDFRVWVAPVQVPCGETWRYAVSAFDLNAESRRSEFIGESGGECNDLALVEVELLSIDPVWINDGSLFGITDHTAENYGHASFSAYTRWTDSRPKGSESDWAGANERCKAQWFNSDLSLG